MTVRLKVKVIKTVVQDEGEFFREIDENTLIEEELVKGFQELIDSNRILRIPQKYRKIAQGLIWLGSCREKD